MTHRKITILPTKNPNSITKIHRQSTDVIWSVKPVNHHLTLDVRLNPKISYVIVLGQINNVYKGLNSQ